MYKIFVIKLHWERTQSAFLSVNDSNIQNNGNKVKKSIKRNKKDRKRMCNRIQEVEMQYALRYKETGLSTIK